MTTKVQIEILQAHMPVVIEVLRSDGTVQYTMQLRSIADRAAEYVHSGQTLRIREMTTQEIHEAARAATGDALAAGLDNG